MTKSKLLFLGLFCSVLVARAQTPALVEDIESGSGSSNPQCYVNYKGKLYFIAGTTSSSGSTMWSWENFGIPSEMIDGGTGTRAHPANSSNIAIEFNGKLYYRGGPANNVDKIMVYDGANPPELAPNTAGYMGTTFSDPVVAANKIFFLGDTTNSSYTSLFSYDGANKPVFIKYLTSPARLNNTLSHLFLFKGKLYFSCFEQSTGLELFSCDPATNAVSLVADICPGNLGSSPVHYVFAGDKFYFAANDSGAGRQLFSYDGQHLKKLTYPNGGSVKNIAENSMAFYRGSLFFSGIVSGGTREALFKYDTVTGAVSLVEDIEPAGSPTVRYLFPTGHNLYFYGRTQAAGAELWRYDGKDCKMVADLNPGTAHGVYGSNFALYEGQLFFTGNDGKTGYELYRVPDLPAPSGIQRAGWEAEVSLYPNPAAASATLAITLSLPEVLHIALTDIMGREVFTTGLSGTAGRNELLFPMSDLAGGQYFYHVKDKSGHLLSSGSVLKQ